MSTITPRILARTSGFGLPRSNPGPATTRGRRLIENITYDARIWQPEVYCGTKVTTLVDELAEHLDRFSGATYVFATPEGEVLHAEDWRATHWRPALERAGLAPLRPHDLKHSGVAFLAAAGAGPSEIARRAGHASVAFTYDRYGHLLPEAGKQAAAKLEAVRAATRLA